MPFPPQQFAVVRRLSGSTIPNLGDDDETGSTTSVPGIDHSTSREHNVSSEVRGMANSHRKRGRYSLAERLKVENSVRGGFENNDLDDLSPR